MSRASKRRFAQFFSPFPAALVRRHHAGTAYVQNIQDMMNMSNDKLSPDQQQFVDDFAYLLLPWGLPITSARLYAYLLLADAPVTLDEFAASLGISKSNASTAARQLEASGIARRQTDRGSKRIRYEVTDDPATALRNHTELLGQMAGLISARKNAVATGANRDRLTDLASFHLSLKTAMEGAIEQHRRKI
jgi:DNA-binding MarR family transcriptional regulator